MPACLFRAVYCAKRIVKGRVNMSVFSVTWYISREEYEARSILKNIVVEKGLDYTE